ncbi:hypothetical protein COW81_01490 [Candidatus Campbellbacteria bacterium CG22_combo_CG10-13_8_21_14_all_36_13]|uniref:DNA 3'-5' helicase n=1 Tax=Candidatus Campbellbacteria bacterium CG22_combo_CG10-13_8_21_14_all_36_13 TaxID=1974529 RepID=A0A2H0DZT9_9BACT|nr:MAG: hypothetical protein COW81_01490 [Candidatus Campbellbacteria bacterium CG22_combo_CG10-13_8_21_14_all_36_13]
MPTSDIFEKSYKNLNTAQKQAVDTIDGPVMVIAGPGTGKTTILTLRIANILRTTDTEPEQILALTFTDSGVNSMRKKLSEIIGSSAYRVNIYTFHGFCNEVIRKYPDYFPRIIGSSSGTEIDQIKIMEEIIDSGDFNLLRPYGDSRYYIRSVLGAIRNLKMDNISPEMFKSLIDEEYEVLMTQDDLYHVKGAYKGKMKGEYLKQEKSIIKNRELILAYDMYEKSLREKKIYDFEDMILEVIHALEKDSEFLLILQEEFQYILADEHQDANNSQNRLLELLSSFHERPNIFIVGDEKQAIYRFQGASLENFLYFRDAYKDVTLINLTENYRSTQTILDSSHSLIENGDKQKQDRPRLVSKKSFEEQNVTLHVFSKPIFEYMYVAEAIEMLIKRGTESNEIAVLYRDNGDVVNLARYLSKTDIPFQIESNTGLLKDEDIRKLLHILRSINSPNDEGLFITMLAIDCFFLVSTDIYKIIDYKNKNKLSVFEIVRSEKHLKDALVEEPKSFIEVYRRFNEWVSASKNKLVLSVLEKVIRESGFLTRILAGGGAINRLATLETFFTEAEKSAEGKDEYYLSDFLDYINTLEQYNIKLSKKGDVVTDGVRLMTAHKSKGLEFKNVFVIGAWHGHWGGRRTASQFKSMHKAISLDSPGDDSDERRLFYVAITRAKETVSISYTTMSDDGRSRLPSQFIEEIDPKFIDEISVFETEKKYATKLDTKYNAEKEYGPNIDDKEYLNKLFLEQGVSVTALNNYLECPWQYFYRNLLRIPSPYEKPLVYGNAIHQVLKEYFDKFKVGKETTKEEATTRFIQLLGKYSLSKTDYDELVEKGGVALSGYIDTYKNTWHKNILNEFNIDGIYINVGDDIDVPIKGKLDKIEIYDGYVNVVDYKTGKPKSRNDIEGNTKYSGGNYKRQLVFYKLLLDLFEDGKYVMKSGEIDFIEPQDNGKYRKEQFDIYKEDVEELKEEVIRVSKEILDLSFWGKTCDNEKCEFCALHRTVGK